MVTISIKNKIILLSLLLLLIVVFKFTIFDFINKEANLQFLYDIARSYDLPV